MNQTTDAPLENGTTPLVAGLARLRRRIRGLQPHSVRVRLYSVFALLFFLVFGLGAFGFARLSAVNRVSEVIRNHWLRDTRILGDLSNYMSDFRTAEATQLLASTPLEFSANEKEIASLGAIVARSQRAYEEIAQEPPEALLYAQFTEQWAAYQAVAAQVIALARTLHTSDGVLLYNTTSRRAFDISSDTLSRLTDQTVAKAQRVSALAAATYQRARTLIVTAMLLATSLVIGVILYIRRSILAPLLELATCMRALADQNTEIAIPSVRREDEMGEMARSVAVFRDNALALANSQRRLIDQAAALEQGLENERRLTAQERDFVAMTSHEFRTPLTIIDGHAQRLIKMSDRLGPKSIAERGARIRSAVQRITNIMDSLLSASRVLDGQAVFHPTELEPAMLLHDACKVHRDAARGVVISEDYSSVSSTIRGDPKLLFHAFSNLISNAIKYSPTGSPIEVVARQEAAWLEVQVRDCGIGIPARDREHLFERYFRGSNATGIAGTGVGLHLVSMVVALHGGEVFVESIEGVGSRFMVRLPIPTPEEAAPRATRRDGSTVCTTTEARPLLLSAVLFAALACPAFLARADKETAPANARLEEIVVTAKRRPDPVADEKLRRQVEEALHADAFFYGEHVTATINDGIVTLQGRVFDGGDMRSALRISRKIPGVKRVVNNLEIEFELGGWDY